jgi:hypothetical protein
MIATLLVLALRFAPVADVAMKSTPVGGVITARVGARTVHLLVETGSNQTVLDLHLRPPGITVHEQAAGHDVGGRATTVVYATNVPLRVGKMDIALAYLFFSRFDAQFARKYHVDGVISPQQLATHAAVLIDYRSNRLILFRTTAFMRGWIEQNRPQSKLTIHIGNALAPHVAVYGWTSSDGTRHTLIGRDALSRFTIAIPRQPSNEVWLVR